MYSPSYFVWDFITFYTYFLRSCQFTFLFQFQTTYWSENNFIKKARVISEGNFKLAPFSTIEPNPFVLELKSLDPVIWLFYDRTKLEIPSEITTPLTSTD